MYDKTYACHDSITCGIKYGNNNSTFSTGLLRENVFMSSLFTEDYFK
ncbi:359_t:CDS:1, partial [Scutellospora calospora]